MKIVVDDKIPYIEGVLEPFADVIYLPGSETTPEVVKDADALITRTRTICDAVLLEGSTVKFIASATIGFDHIDTAYCQKAGIQWANAPGCNAESVKQYLAAAILTYAKRKKINLHEKTVGIVGVGNVGSRVGRFCQIMGMTTLKNDPPRQRRERGGEFVSLEEIKREADIISFHVPLNRDGVDKTFHMVDREFLSDLPKKPLLINTCRGEVFNSSALLLALESKMISGLILDCWENEPDINLQLLELVDLGTCHIAGYSQDGKANGTISSVRQISRFFHLGLDDWKPENIAEPDLSRIQIDGYNKSDQDIIGEAVDATYRIEKDDQALRNAPNQFEKLRGAYPLRREFSYYTIFAKNISQDTLEKLRSMGFMTRT